MSVTGKGGSGPTADDEVFKTVGDLLVERNDPDDFQASQVLRVNLQDLTRALRPYGIVPCNWCAKRWVLVPPGSDGDTCSHCLSLGCAELSLDLMEELGVFTEDEATMIQDKINAHKSQHNDK